MPSIKLCGYCDNFVPLGSPVIDALNGGGLIRFCSAKCFLDYCEREKIEHEHDPEYDSLCNDAIDRGLKENPGLTLETATDQQILSWVSRYSRESGN